MMTQRENLRLTSEVQGDEIDESRLMSFVDQTLDADFTSALLDAEARYYDGYRMLSAPGCFRR